MSAFHLPAGAYGEPLPLEWDEPVSLPRLPTPPDPRAHLSARPVGTDADALAMGRIRSERAAGFSHNTRPIADADQLAWWRRNRERLDAWLFEDDAGRIVGYGALRQEADGRWFSSVAVAKGHSGHSYGLRITTWLVSRWPHEVWASARDDNPGAMALHDDLIWEQYGWHEGLYLYRTRPKVRVSGDQT
jgi:hypothetical protein